MHDMRRQLGEVECLLLLGRGGIPQALHFSQNRGVLLKGGFHRTAKALEVF